MLDALMLALGAADLGRRGAVRRWFLATPSPTERRT